MTEDQWTIWGDKHPWIAGLMQLALYGLIWFAVILGACLVAGVLSLVVGALRG